MSTLWCFRLILIMWVKHTLVLQACYDRAHLLIYLFIFLHYRYPYQSVFQLLLGADIGNLSLISKLSTLS